MATFTYDTETRGFWSLLVAGTRVAQRIGSRGGTRPTGRTRLTPGTASGQIDQLFELALNIAAGATLQVDVRSGQSNPAGAAVVLAKVKSVYLELATPGASVRFGPQGLTNAVQLGFGGVASTDRLTVHQGCPLQWGNQDGWTADATHKVIGVHNPGAAAVTGWLIVTGVAA